MQRSCAYCGGRHNLGERCSKLPQPEKKTYKKQYDRTNRERIFRSGRAWTQKSKYIRTRDMYLCVVCLKNGVYTTATSVHHIDPLVKAWSKRLDNNNLISLCNRHHELAECGKISKQELRAMIPKDDVING